MNRYLDGTNDNNNNLNLDYVKVTSTLDSTSKTTGSITTGGGIGMGGSLYLGGKVYIPAGPNLVLIRNDGTTTVGSIGYDTTTSGLMNINNGSGGGIIQLTSQSRVNLSTPTVYVLGTTDSTSAITGSIQIVGGMGLAKALYMGSATTATGNITQISSGACSHTRAYGGSAATYIRTTVSSTGIYTVANASSVGVNLAVGATSWSAASDYRLKEDIVSIDVATALSNVNRLRPVTFKYKIDKSDAPKRQGMIAQECETVYKDIVTKNEEGYLSIAYADIIPQLIASIQALTKEVESLKKKVK
ncbi:MAG: hypothetical protein JWO77_3899 [Ilumatobacteraceae bacterium]|nr:hypothetical protein [Ilumatobacteraceae bacterium]MDB5177439.1 hypothetical protein [Candidatus Saccharibacteria bacterium]